MTNHLNAFIGEAKETFAVIIFVIIGIIILFTIGVSLSMQEVTNQMINSISGIALFYLGLPSLAIFGLIFWVAKKFTEPVGF